MKKLLIILSNVLIVSSLAIAQNDKKASEILEQMNKNYVNMKSFSAEFTYDIEGANAKLTQSYKGNVTVKGLKYRLKMPGADIMNNGKEVYEYSKETNEVKVTDSNPNADADFSPAKIYTIYKKGYKFVFLQEVKEGSQFYEVIDLSPDAKDSKTAKVQIKVNKKDKTVKSWKIWDKNGKRQIIRIDKMTPNAPADDAQFTFDKKAHPGVEIVDLR